MASSIPDEDFAGDTPLERAAHYWKKAADMYRLACQAESGEVKTLYMHMAMSWAALAHEIERALPEPRHEGGAMRAGH
jgi:hypothetical protein